MRYRCCNLINNMLTHVPPDIDPPDPETGTLYIYNFAAFLATTIEITPVGFPPFQWSYGAGAWYGFLAGEGITGGEVVPNPIYSGEATVGWMLTTLDVSGWTYIDLNNPTPPIPFVLSPDTVNPQLRCFINDQDGVPIDASLAAMPYITSGLGEFFVNNTSIPFLPLDDPSFESTADSNVKIALGNQASYTQVINGTDVEVRVNNIYFDLSGFILVDAATGGAIIPGGNAMFQTPCP